MADEFRKYDSDDSFLAHNARLTKDAEVKETEHGTLVRLTFVSSSRQQADSEIWIEATPTDYQADLAAFLKKGDVLGIGGKLCMRRYGDSNEKVAFNLRRAQLHVPPAMFAVLKERGFTPGAKGEKETKAPAKKAAKPPAAKKTTRQVEDLPDLDS